MRKRGTESSTESEENILLSSEEGAEEKEAETQVTIRALLVGGLSGTIVAVSNIYVGLKIGL